MSRSYKKSPWSGDSGPWWKRQANKKVRRYKKDLSNGKDYKKLYCSWDICDYGSYKTLNSWLTFAKDKSNNHYCWDTEYDETKEILKWKKWYLWR